MVMKLRCVFSSWDESHRYRRTFLHCYLMCVQHAYLCVLIKFLHHDFTPGVGVEIFCALAPEPLSIGNQAELVTPPCSHGITVTFRWSLKLSFLSTLNYNETAFWVGKISMAIFHFRPAHAPVQMWSSAVPVKFVLPPPTPRTIGVKSIGLDPTACWKTVPVSPSKSYAIVDIGVELAVKRPWLILQSGLASTFHFDDLY